MKMKALLGIFCKISFTPAVTSCYLSGTRPNRRCTPICDATMLL